MKRNIWMYWDRGVEHPSFLKRDGELVKLCVWAWEKMNPGWDINILDDTTIKQYIPDSEEKSPT